MTLTAFKNRKWQRQRNDNDAYLDDLNQMVNEINALPGTSTVLGYYATLAALTVAHPAGANGQFAIVGNTIYIWDPISAAWITIGDTLYKGVLDASVGIPYPAAQVGEFWRISVAGTIGSTRVEVGDQVICIATYAGGIDDTKFMIVQTNTQITDVTYAQLQVLITDGALETGRQYRITDYATAYNIFDGGTNAVIEAKVGPEEPLIVLATGDSTLAKEAFSSLYPNDIIYYNPLVEATKRAAFIAAGDIAFVTAGSLVAGFKGLIEFRHDTKQNVSTWYDFRNIKFRRWAVDADTYDGGTAYVENDLCKGSDNAIYKCTTATTGEGDPTVNNADWILFWDINTNSYISWTSSSSDFIVGNANMTNLILNPALYQDVYTFGSSYNIVRDVHIGKVDIVFTTNQCNYISSLNNMVFNLTGSVDTCYDLQFGPNCILNTFHESNNNCKFYSFFNRNIFTNEVKFNDFIGIVQSNISSAGIKNVISVARIENNVFAYGAMWCNINYDIAGFNFPLNSHVTKDYYCTIFSNAASQIKLSYFDAANALTVVNVNA